ncbi:MAG: hypothetical protein KatS3mg105_3183 [Gemmatales bacterium]|nr:MAG: hypothetical protein KatS3mg105_3183 [Gemmatales bacterium]
MRCATVSKRTCLRHGKWGCMMAAVLACNTLTSSSSYGQTTLPLADNRDAYQPAVAFGKDVYLVAWKSGHLAEGDLRKGLNYVGDIVGCRVNAAGKPVDAKPFSICAASDLQEWPRIAFGDSVFLVVWHDIRNGKDWDVYAARVTPEGKVLDRNGILVGGGKHNQAVPDVAWDGKNFQVVWQDFRSGNRYEVYGARVTESGKVLEAGGRLLATAKPPFSRINPVLASAGGGKSLLFWLGGGRAPGGRNGVVAGAHLLQDGHASKEPTMENTDPRSAPGGITGHVPFPVSAAAGPNKLLVVWPTSAPYGRGDAPNDSHAGLFTRDARLEKTVVLPQEKIRGQLSNSRIRHPSATWNGKTFVMAWHQDAEEGRDGVVKWPSEAIFCASIAPDGKTRDRQWIAGTPSAPAIHPAIASDGNGTTLIVFEQHPEKADTPICIGARLLKQGD